QFLGRVADGQVVVEAQWGGADQVADVALVPAEFVEGLAERDLTGMGHGHSPFLGLKAASIAAGRHRAGSRFRRGMAHRASERLRLPRKRPWQLARHVGGFSVPVIKAVWSGRTRMRWGH